MKSEKKCEFEKLEAFWKNALGSTVPWDASDKLVIQALRRDKEIKERAKKAVIDWLKRNLSSIEQGQIIKEVGKQILQKGEIFCRCFCGKIKVREIVLRLRLGANPSLNDAGISLFLLIDLGHTGQAGSMPKKGCYFTAQWDSKRGEFIVKDRYFGNLESEDPNYAILYRNLLEKRQPQGCGCPSKVS